MESKHKQEVEAPPDDDFEDEEIEETAYKSLSEFFKIVTFTFVHVLKT